MRGGMPMRSVIFAAAVLLLLPVVVAQEWSGADELAEGKIQEIAPEYKPWFSPVWEPPSGEIESFLFALQASIGSLIIGYLIGYYRGERKCTRS